MDMNDLKKEAREAAQAALKASVGTALVGFEAFFDDKDVPDHHKHKVAATLQSLFERLNDAAYSRDVTGIAGAFGAGRPNDRIAMVTGDTFHAPSIAPAASLGALSSGPTVSDAQYAQLEQVAKTWSTTVEALIANLPDYITTMEAKAADLERERDAAQRKLAEEHDPAIVGSLAQQLESAKASEAAANADLSTVRSDLASVQALLGETDAILSDVYAAFGVNPGAASDGPSLVAALQAAIPPAPADRVVADKARAHDDIVAEARKRGVTVTHGMTPAAFVAALASSGSSGGGKGLSDPNSPEFTSVRAIIESFFNGHAPALGKKSWVVARPPENVLKAAQMAVGLPDTGFAPPAPPTP